MKSVTLYFGCMGGPNIMVCAQSHMLGYVQTQYTVHLHTKSTVRLQGTEVCI